MNWGAFFTTVIGVPLILAAGWGLALVGAWLEGQVGAAAAVSIFLGVPVLVAGLITGRILR